VGLHVRVPDASSLGSAIVTEYRIPARGGVVAFASGDRIIRREYPDTARLDARADADMRAFLYGLIDKVRRELSDPVTRPKLASLPGVERQALELRVLDEISYEEIANRTGVSVSQARARVSAALAALGIDLHGMLP
jgi:DNA-directed RNA polymerase specialized sigma24 family protein